MSTNENDKLDAFISEFRKFADKTGQSLAKLDRGVYGDKDNKTPGLIDRQIEDEKRIAALEEANKKRTWIMIGASAVMSGLTFLVSLLWEAFKQK